MKTDLHALVRKNIQNLAPYSSAREEYAGTEGVFLDANENPFGTLNRYPDPYQRALKQRLADIKGISPNCIFIGNGSDEIIDLAFRIFCEPHKDKVLIFTPTYGMYEVAAGIHAVETVKLPLDTRFQIDRKKLQPWLCDKALKLIFICSPNNPTGNLLRTGDIEFILQNFHGIVIIDEAYHDFCDQPSCIEKLSRHSNLVVVQTLSKAWGLAGIRIGLAYMNEDTLAYFNKVKAPYNVSALNQKAALEVLSHPEKCRQEVKTILREKQKLIAELQRMRIVRKIYPTDANFLLAEVEHADALYRKLTGKQIVVRNRNSIIKNCLRISIGTPRENQHLVNILNEINHG